MKKPSRNQITIHSKIDVYEGFKDKCAYKLLPMNVVLEAFMKAFVEEYIVLNIVNNEVFFSKNNTDGLLIESEHKTPLYTETTKKLFNTSVNVDLYKSFSKKCSMYNALTTSLIFEVFMKQYYFEDFSLSLV